MPSAAGDRRVLWANPVLQKELRMRWRGWRLVWLPLAMLVVLTSVCGIGLLSQVFSHPDLTAILASLAGLAAAIGNVAAWFLTPALTATGLAAERKQLTLESLLLTRLTTGEIVRGKLVGGLVPTALTVLPAWLLALTLYAATLDMKHLPDAATVLLALPAAVLAAASLSTLVSALARGPGGAVVGAYACVGILLVVLHIAQIATDVVLWDFGRPGGGPTGVVVGRAPLVVSAALIALGVRAGICLLVAAASLLLAARVLRRQPMGD